MFKKNGKKEDTASLEVNSDDIKMEKQLTGDNKGMYGNVWRGSLYKKEVAIKVPKSQDLTEEELDDLKKEIKIWRDNPHGNVVQFLGACTQDGNVRIVVELMDGDIADLIREDKTVSNLDILDFARQAALGMNWLHRKSNIVHRDLKPANVMFKRVGGVYTIKVGDFGLSVVKPRHKKLTDCAGSPLYMPPEVLAGEPYGFEQDVYAFGVSLWQVMTRNAAEPYSHLPHGGDFDIFAGHVLDGKRPPLEGVPTITGLHDLINDCWDGDPKKRPTFEKIIQRLEVIEINAAISDPNGRKFWREKFLEKYKSTPTSTVPLNTMVQELYSFLGYNSDLVKVIKYEEARENQELEVENRYQLQMTGDTNYELRLDEDENSVAPGQAKPVITNDPDCPPAEEIYTYRCLVALFASGSSKRLSEKQVGLVHFGSILKWLGPLTHDSKADKDFLKRIVNTLKQSYFHGDIDRDEAKGRLRGTPDGTFLIRFSGTPGLFVFSCMKAGQFKEGRITYDQEKGFTSDGGKSFYPTLHSFVAKSHAKLGMQRVCAGSKYEELFVPIAVKGGVSSPAAAPPKKSSEKSSEEKPRKKKSSGKKKTSSKKKKSSSESKKSSSSEGKKKRKDKA